MVWSRLATSWVFSDAGTIRLVQVLDIDVSMMNPILGRSKFVSFFSTFLV